MSNSKLNPIVTEAETCSGLAGDLARQSEKRGKLSKQMILKTFAKWLAGENHDWGFIKNATKPVVSRKVQLPTQEVQVHPEEEDLVLYAPAICLEGGDVRSTICGTRAGAMLWLVGQVYEAYRGNFKFSEQGEPAYQKFLAEPSITTLQKVFDFLGMANVNWTITEQVGTTIAAPAKSSKISHTLHDWKGDKPSEGVEPSSRGVDVKLDEKFIGLDFEPDDQVRTSPTVLVEMSGDCINVYARQHPNRNPCHVCMWPDGYMEVVNQDGPAHQWLNP